MVALPVGTVTFLFTDVEGSTRLWEAYPDAMRDALVHHDAIVEFLTEQHHGRVVRPRGEGDSRFCVFARASDAVHAAAAIQKALGEEAWPTPTPMRVRMALHTGEADLREGDYYGSAVNRCARLRALAHGGQTLLSDVTADLVREGLRDGLALRDLGQQRLKDLTAAERVYQLFHPALPAEFPPLRSLDAVPNNLPLQVTSFVGRERDLAHVKELASRHRLVTLTGTGGAGKTRLALQVAAELLEAFPDGAWFVDLAPLAEPALVVPAALTALGVRELPGQAAEAALLEHLRGKTLLLVLDNCEHLVEDAARLADRLVHSAAGVRVLATSREMLGVSGETAWRVPSLSAPDPEEAASAAAIAGYEAVRLFAERARLVDDAFQVTDGNARAVAQVCARLDGIPLALELAAARVRVLSVEQIAQRLDQRFRLLTGGGRTALRRQQTLQALVDWSHDLLSPDECALFRRLAVFAGGWTLEAAEAVCGFGPLEAHDVLDRLTDLVDKSLVVAEAEDGAERYRFLETIRQYAEDKLFQAGEAEEARDRHRDYWLEIRHRAVPPYVNVTGFMAEWRRRLRSERENIRAALAWCTASPEGAAIGLDMCPLAMALQSSATLEWCETFLGLAQAPTSARARALLLLGHLLRWRRGFARARDAADEAASIFAAVGDAAGACDARVAVGLVHGNLGEYARARELIEEGLAWARGRGDAYRVQMYLRDLGVLSIAAGDLVLGRSATEESERVSAGLGVYALNPLRLAIVDRLEGDFAGCRARLAELTTRFPDPSSFAAIQTRAELANLTRDEGRPGEACAQLAACLIEAARGGDPVAELLCMLGMAEIARGAVERGVSLIATGSPDGSPPGTIHMPGVRVEVPVFLARARSALGEAGYAAVWERGRTVPLERAIREAAEVG